MVFVQVAHTLIPMTPSSKRHASQEDPRATANNLPKTFEPHPQHKKSARSVHITKRPPMTTPKSPKSIPKTAKTMAKTSESAPRSPKADRQPGIKPQECPSIL